MRSIVFLTACCVSIASFARNEVGASDWGCEVLLCAASSDPSWHSIASCRPPMEKLISAMKKPGFSWPTCPEGGAGKPGFDQYADCPSGWIPAQGDNSGNGAGRDQLSQCKRIVDGCGRAKHGNEGALFKGTNDVRRVYADEHSCSYTELIKRPLRDKPYYFDIRDDAGNATGRHFFSLKK